MLRYGQLTKAVSDVGRWRSRCWQRGKSETARLADPKSVSHQVSRTEARRVLFGESALDGADKQCDT